MSVPRSVVTWYPVNWNLAAFWSFPPEPAGVGSRRCFPEPPDSILGLIGYLPTKAWGMRAGVNSWKLNSNQSIKQGWSIKYADSNIGSQRARQLMATLCTISEKHHRRQLSGIIRQQAEWLPTLNLASRLQERKLHKPSPLVSVTRSVIRPKYLGRCWRIPTVLITGISPNSLGEAIAVSCSHHSPALLVLVSLTQAHLEKVAADIHIKNPDVKIQLIQLDLSDQTAVRDAASKILDDVEIPRIDILINNAAV